MNPEKSVRQSLGGDHEAISQRLTDLANAVEGADFPTILEVFREVDGGLRAHMYGEERYLFEHFEKSHPEQIRALRADHDRFHRKLDELMIQTELHTLRKERIDELIDELRSHAAREDDTLYKWADEPLHETQRDALFQFLAERRQALREPS
jgi:iron-sulfur cluster repair protein YtfE (RIC family)